MIKIEAAIFDMDGLLIDSERFWKQAEREISATVGIRLTPEIIKETTARKEVEVVAYWFKLFPWQGITQQQLADLVIERVIALMQARVRLMPGALAALKLCAAQRMPIAIASSSPAKVISVMAKKFSFKTYVRVFHSADSEAFGKPHPGVYISAARKLEVNPKQCVAFEDSPNGVLAAKAAGMICVAVPNQMDKNDPRFSKADLVLTSLKDFHWELLKKLSP